MTLALIDDLQPESRERTRSDFPQRRVFGIPALANGAERKAHVRRAVVGFDEHHRILGKIVPEQVELDLESVLTGIRG